jgi:hypothetical protein
MDVYLVPVGADRYELYCEVADEPDVGEPAAPRGFFRRLGDRFRELLAEAERDRREPHRHTAQKGWIARGKARLMRWVAESIAEQRLLWHLRGQRDARLFYPDDLDDAKANAILRAQIGRDYDKHRFWLTLDALGLIASGLLMLVPGPNVLAYYFAFRVVGHYFSLRGARQGLMTVRWVAEKSGPLSDLRTAIGLAPDMRTRHVHDVAARLRLEHLASFFERTAIQAS